MKTKCYYCGAEYEISWKDAGEKCECAICHKKFIVTIPKEEIEKNINMQVNNSKTQIENKSLEVSKKITITEINLSIGNIFSLLLKFYIALLPFCILVFLMNMLIEYAVESHNTATIFISFIVLLAFVLGLPILLIVLIDRKMKINKD